MVPRNLGVWSDSCFPSSPVGVAECWVLSCHAKTDTSGEQDSLDTDSWDTGQSALLSGFHLIGIRKAN